MTVAAAAAILVALAAAVNFGVNHGPRQFLLTRQSCFLCRVCITYAVG